jgi:N6-L-threonylcarbamoyladenine synthase
MRGRPGCDMSFAGLKTNVRQQRQRMAAPTDRDVADLAAGFQAAVSDVLADRCANALQRFRDEHGVNGPLVVAGGVAANAAIRSRLETLAAEHGAGFVAPPLNLCTDNAAMIAWAGLERLRLGWTDPLDFKPRPRWPLTELTAPAQVVKSK